MARHREHEIEALQKQLADATRHAESLRRVIESISSELALAPLLTRIVGSAVELLEAQYGTIGLVIEKHDGPVVRTAAVYNMPTRELGAEMGPGIGLAGQVLQTRRPLHAARYGDLDLPTLPELAEHTVLGMPIWWGNQMIGFFGIGAEPPRRFSERDIETLALFARHTAIAIENARRYEREQRRTERLALIAHIGNIVTADMNLDDMLQRAADAIHELLGYPYVSLALVDQEQPATLILRAESGIHEARNTKEFRLPISQGILGAAVRQREVMLINDVATNKDYLPTPGAVGIRAELAIPILHGEQILGVLNVENSDPFTDEDATSLGIVADQLAVAIENTRLFGRTQHALDETRLLYDTILRISTGMDIDSVVAAYLEQVAVRQRYACTVALYAFNAMGMRNAVIIRGRWTPEHGLVQQPQQYPYSHDALDTPLDRGITVLIEDTETDPRVSDVLREIQRRDARPALALIPLMARNQRIGLVILSYPAAHRWSQIDLQPYLITAAQLATAIDHRQQQQLLAERGQQLAVLEERRRLARNLHDSVTQLIFSTTLIAQSIIPAWRRDPSEGERRVNRLLELSQASLAEMRALLAELRPAETNIAPAVEQSVSLATPAAMMTWGGSGSERLRRDGLVAALHWYIDTLPHDSIHINIKADHYLQLALTEEETLFRIAQEALNNAIKHAAAQHITVELLCDNDGTVLLVHDDGIGFEAVDGATTGRTEPRQRQGLGLQTMRDRAEAAQAAFSIHSIRDQGTTVEVHLPKQAVSMR